VKGLDERELQKKDASNLSTIMGIPSMTL